MPFIESEVQPLLQEDITEPSNSPRKDQVLVISNERHKKWMVTDYSQTVNCYMQLDAYRLSRIDDQINEVAKNKVCSTIDLKDAYHQVKFRDEDKIFEAAGRLWQYKRMPSGVTNGVACFHRVMDKLIDENDLKGTFAYLDNVTICERDQEEHYANLAKFLAVQRKPFEF